MTWRTHQRSGLTLIPSRRANSTWVKPLRSHLATVASHHVRSCRISVLRSTGKRRLCRHGRRYARLGAPGRVQICRYLHGKVFEVDDALRGFDALDRLDAPEDVKQAQPWVREAADAATGHRVLYVDRGGVRTPIVEVTRSGFGRGTIVVTTAGASATELVDLGVRFPPYHDAGG